MQVMERRDALELMQKCRAWIRSVFDFALSEEMIAHNPVPQKDLVLKKHKEKRHPGLKNREDAAQFLRNLFEYPGRAETRLAIWLQMLMATRPSELRLAETSFDADTDTGLVRAGYAALTTLVGITEAWPSVVDQETDPIRIVSAIVPGAPLEPTHEVPDANVRGNLHRPAGAS